VIDKRSAASVTKSVVVALIIKVFQFVRVAICVIVGVAASAAVTPRREVE
jgi:hypothetical protein